MDTYQEEVYNYFEDIEEKKEKLRIKMYRGKIGDSMSTYSSYTRQACNFVFPMISELINGEKRPRPSNFKLKDTDAAIIDEGNDIDKKQLLVKTKAEVLEYIKAIRIYINSFIEFMKDILRDDKKKNYTLSDDVKVFHTKYKSDFTNFFEKEQKKSKLFINMYMYSPKFVRIIFNILNTKGTVMIYSNYVEMEGLQLLKVYLSFFGFIDIDKDLDQEFNKNKLNDTNKLSKDGLRWCEFHGGIDKDVRRLNKDIFNMKSNRYGKHCKIIMISPAGAEGINLNNVRQVHILEPYWNEVRIEQVIGRALRFCQHKDLPLEERIVDVFRYKVIRSSGKETADERLENISRKKNNLLLSFSEAVKSAAVDCELFKAHNMMGSKYKCFQFNEESLFEKPIGPAFQVKINYDLKLDNGLNAKDSNIKRIKIRKIKAVQMTDENTYSTEEIYWLNEDTNIVYDNLLNYPIGKLSKDENNQYKLLENDVYIIEDIIYVPKIQLYE